MTESVSLAISAASGNPVPSGVNPIQNIIGSRFAGEELKVLGAWAATAAAKPAEIIEALGLVHGAAPNREFVERDAEDRIIAINFQADGPLIPAIDKNSFGLPGRQLLLGKGLGIAGQLERFEPQNRRGSMVSMGAARLRRKAIDDHIGPELADDAHNVGQHLLPIPNAERFPVILGKAKIHGAGEELAAAVQPAGRQQFLRARHAQFLVELRAEHILTAIAARD